MRKKDLSQNICEFATCFFSAFSMPAPYAKVCRALFGEFFRRVCSSLFSTAEDAGAAIVVAIVVVVTAASAAADSHSSFA